MYITRTLGHRMYEQDLVPAIWCDKVLVRLLHPAGTCKPWWCCVANLPATRFADQYQPAVSQLTQ